jgi:hypothetical protein
VNNKKRDAENQTKVGEIQSLLIKPKEVIHELSRRLADLIAEYQSSSSPLYKRRKSNGGCEAK